MRSDQAEQKLQLTDDVAGGDRLDAGLLDALCAQYQL